MFNRFTLKAIINSLRHYPAIGIVGPRQSGKTTLVKSMVPVIKNELHKEAIYLDLELNSDLNKLQDPEFFLQSQAQKTVIIDEIQREPSLFPLLRALIDQQREPARFILLGSASPALMRDSSESLAGRIAYHELMPLNYIEVHARVSLEEHWLKGGFPSALLATEQNTWFDWLRNFIRTYVERDFVQLGLTAPSSLTMRLLMMIGNYQGGLWNSSNFSKALGVNRPALNSYLDFLEQAFMVYRLQPYHLNLKKRLVKSPKVYIRDSGILHQLTGIHNLQSLQGNVLAGNSWEGYVVEQIRQLIYNKMDLYFYRTHDGSEVDLVICKGIKPVATVEVKYSLSPTTTKGYTVAIEDVNAEQNYIIIPKAEEFYPLRKKVFVAGVFTFLNTVLPQLLSEE